MFESFFKRQAIMLKILLLAFMPLTSLKAQNADSLMKDTTIYKQAQVDKPAEFPGGNHSIYQTFGYRFHFTAQSVDNHAKGKQIVTFIIEKDGSISNIKFSATIGYGLEEESIRVFKAFPKWNPALINGAPVRSIISGFPLSLSVGQ
ncbi:MAG: energy transducer TonB [Mucilaginibacter sp.]|jgi:hypothetical protein|uniref:energy transducer TonB n=1 Tax=Mucilaginibacter sp. TaxID=1882438 RepID=UPI003568AAD1